MCLEFNNRQWIILMPFFGILTLRIKRRLFVLTRTTLLPCLSESSTMYQLDHAIRTNDIERLKRLLDNSEKSLVNGGPEYQSIPLITAAALGNLEAVELLLEKHANVHRTSYEHGITALHLAARVRHYDLVELLLIHKANPNQQDDNGDTPLIVASFWGHLLSVMHLLQAKACPNAKNHKGNPPLYYAIKQGHLLVVKQLLEANANPCEKMITNSEFAPIHVATYHNQFEILEQCLLPCGVDVDQTAKDGITALGVSAARGHERIAKLLLDHNANINHIRTNGHTPLMLACKKQQQAIVQLFLNYNVDINRRSADGTDSAYSIALKYNQTDIACMLFHHQMQSNQWFRDPYMVKQLPPVLNRQLKVLAYLWSASVSGESTLLDTLPLELLHSLFFALYHLHNSE